MTTTASNKRKKAVVATVAAAALLLGGTFAWTSISQQALNESAGVVNVGGRLHDDFNGTNKDVYVENFTDPLDGGQPIYARVKLTEYMEVGQDAGGVDDGDGIEEVVTILDGTVRNQEETWKPHVPADLCNTCDAEGNSCVIHDHWTWTMGGEDIDNNPEGKTIYMPTFNKDKDSLLSDRNGTYHGTVDTDKIYYDDYVVYDENGAENIAFADKERHDGNIASVEGTAYYDDDTNTEENSHDPLAGARAKAETHRAKETAGATVMTMKDWQDAGSNPGPYWVYDNDGSGWAYWAAPIMPGEATGLLLDQIEMTRNPGEKCYYGINVVAQFATVGDWEYFHPDNGTSTESDISDNARELLQQAANTVPVVTVTRTGDANVQVGDRVQFEAQTTFGGATTFGLEDFVWKVFDADLNEETTSTFADNDDGTVTLTVGDGAAGKNLIVAAYAQDYPGAVGLSSLAVEAKEVAGTATFEYITGIGGPYQQDIRISGIADDDYPLTIFAYLSKEELGAYTDENLMNTITVEKSADGITYNLQSQENEAVSTAYMHDLALEETGSLYMQYNIVPEGEDGEGAYLSILVEDSKKRKSKMDPQWIEIVFGCFAAGTQVATADGLVNIEDIQLGDMVYSMNMESGEKELAEVTWVQPDRVTEATYTIYTADEKIVTTYEHPFYVEEKQEFVAAEDLKVGDTLKSMNGKTAVIEKIVYEELDEPIPVYNFTVEGNHNYLISGAELLVHNVMK